MSTKDNQLGTRVAVWAAAGIGAFLAARALYREITKFDLNKKVVLITGGARGLGLVLARQLALKGARLAICSRTPEQLLKAQAELEALGAKVLALSVDLTDREEVNRMIHDVLEHYGEIDVVINNAGIIQTGPADSMTLQDYEQAMKTNFWGPLYVIHAVLPYFRKMGEGRIINISSIGGKIAVPHLLPYTASKFALTGLSEGLHAELRKFNIRVTTVIPNLMRTGSAMNITVKGNHEEEYAWFKMAASSPLLSQKVEQAATRIVQAIEYGETETILTPTAKLATSAQAIAPKLMAAILSLANRFLPDNIPGGTQAVKGYQAESRKSRGPISSISDRQAVKNNEQ